MGIYRCSVCGYIFSEEKEKKPFSKLDKCPVCGQPIDRFHPVKETVTGEGLWGKGSDAAAPAYDGAFLRSDPTERYMEEIHRMAVEGTTIHAAMSTKQKMPGWDDILILGAQLNPMPLEDDAPVNTLTVIGKNAKRPMLREPPRPPQGSRRNTTRVRKGRRLPAMQPRARYRTVWRSWPKTTST